MKKIYICILFLIILCIVGSNTVFADRDGPAIMPPISYHDLKIVAVNTHQSMGVVQAYNKDTNKLIWNRKLYEVKIKTSLEEDFQLIFIKSMKIVNDKLIIVNERNVVYELDPDTGKYFNIIKVIIKKSVTILIMLLIVCTLMIRKKMKADKMRKA